MRDVHIVMAACEQIPVVLHACVDPSCGDAGLPVSLSALSPDVHRQFEGGAVVEERGKCHFQTQPLIIGCLVMKMAISICSFIFTVDSLINKEMAALASSFSLDHFNIPDDVWCLLLIESDKIIQRTDL